MKKKAAKLERIVSMQPAYDKRDPNPSKNYGIHGVTMRMVVKGPKGAVQFVLFTGWQLPHVQKELNARLQRDCSEIAVRCHGPMPADLGYHSPKPMYKGQSRMEKCEYTDCGHCYYDGSTLNAEPVFNILLEKGDEGVWQELERYYHSTFGRRSRKGGA